MNIRHINRGDIKEGGCPLCKPARKRYDNELTPLEEVREQLDDVREALDLVAQLDRATASDAVGSRFESW